MTTNGELYWSTGYVRSDDSRGGEFLDLWITKNNIPRPQGWLHMKLRRYWTFADGHQNLPPEITDVEEAKKYVAALVRMDLSTH